MRMRVRIRMRMRMRMRIRMRMRMRIRTFYKVRRIDHLDIDRKDKGEDKDEDKA